MPNLRGSLLRQAAMTIVVALLVAGAIEWWHSFLGACTGLDKPSPLTVCTHPREFWLLDFYIIAVSVIIIGLILQGLLVVVRNIRTEEGATNKIILGSLREEFARNGAGVISIGAAFFGTLASSLLYQPALDLGFPDPFWGLGFLLLMGLPPTFAVFCTLVLAERYGAGSYSPGVTATGTFVGIATGAFFLAMRPFWVLSLVAATFTYLAFVFAHTLQPSVRFSNRVVGGFALISSLLLAPLALTLQPLSAFIVLVYILALGAVLAKRILPRKLPA